MKFPIILIFFLSANNFLFGQTINSNDVIISTLLPDNFSGRYNFGVEYFLNKKNKNIENSKISVGLNVGRVSAVIKNQDISGLNFILESNWYTDLTLPKKWNEYGGLKIAYGNLSNETLKEKKNSYFIGISTGVQPIILKKITLKVNSDIGYVKNGLSTINESIFNNSDNVFYSGFAINFNVGLGIRF